MKRALFTAALSTTILFQGALIAQEEPKEKRKLIKAEKADVKPRTPNLAWSIGDVKGATVKNVQGETLGTVSDVVVEQSTGRVKLALVSVGGFLGIGDKLVAVPWKSLSAAGTDNKQLVLDATRGELETAPAVDSPQINNANYRDWLEWSEEYFAENRVRKSADAKEKASPARKKAEKKAEKKEDRKPEKASPTPAASPEPAASPAETAAE